MSHAIVIVIPCDIVIVIDIVINYAAEIEIVHKIVTASTLCKREDSISRPLYLWIVPQIPKITYLWIHRRIYLWLFVDFYNRQ